MNPPAADLWPGERPSSEQAEEQLACLLASESFSGAQRSRDFLGFIVGEALAGRRDRLSGPDGPHMALYRAGTLARLGRAEEARREVDSASAFPYELDMRNFLGAFRDPKEARKLLDSLESVGFDTEAVSVAVR